MMVANNIMRALIAGHLNLRSVLIELRVQFCKPSKTVASLINLEIGMRTDTCIRI